MTAMIPLRYDGLVSSYRDSINSAISENRLEDALNYLQDCVNNLTPQLRDAVLLLRRKYSQFRHDFLMNTADQNEPDILCKMVLDIVGEVERLVITSKGATPSSIIAPVNDGDIPPLARGIIGTITSDPLSSAPDSHQECQTTDAVLDENEQLRSYWQNWRNSRPREVSEAVVCSMIAKSYKNSHFRLDELSISLRLGEITAIVGRNASGKTTLLRMILGDILPDTGSVDYPVLAQQTHGWAYIKRQIAYVSQTPAKWRGALRDNLCFIAAAHGITGKANSKFVEWNIQRYGLADYETSTWDELSGGYRLRYDLVRALVSSPKLMILDEPLASLDVTTRQEFLNNLKVIAYSLQNPIPIVVTSQNLYEMEGIADQMVVLDKGKCVFCGPLCEIERTATSRLFELNINLARKMLEARVFRLGMKIIEAISDGYIVSADLSMNRHEAMKLLVSEFGDKSVAIRDITGSSRRFFISLTRP